MTAMRLKRYPSPSGGFALGKIGVGATMLKQGKTARDYVQTGLVAMWDGIENAGWGAHDASATTWKDLIEGIECNVYQNEWTDSSLLLTNSSGFPLNSVGLKYNSDLTIFCRLKNPSYLNTAYYATLLGLGDSSGYEKGLCIQFGHRTQAVEARTSYSGSVLASVPLGITTPSLIKSYCIVWHRSTLSFDVYMDGSILGSATIFEEKYHYDNQNNGFGAAGHGTLSNVEIFYAGLYSRALTADEIARNYAIDKERFNLP